jgi:hypothetical protein
MEFHAKEARGTRDVWIKAPQQERKLQECRGCLPGQAYSLNIKPFYLWPGEEPPEDQNDAMALEGRASSKKCDSQLRPSSVCLPMLFF